MQSGEKRRLSSEQEKEIQGIIVDKTPEELLFRECVYVVDDAEQHTIPD